MILDDIGIPSCAVWRIVHAPKWFHQLGVRDSWTFGLLRIVMERAFALVPAPEWLWLQPAIVHDHVRVSARAITLVRRELLVVSSVAWDNRITIHFIIKLLIYD